LNPIAILAMHRLPRRLSGQAFVFLARFPIWVFGEPQVHHMTRFFGSLRLRLVGLVLLAVVPAMGVVTYSAFEQRRLATAQTQENARQVVTAAASVQEQMIESTRQFLTVLAQFPILRGPDHAACSAFLVDLAKQYPRYSSLTVSDPHGNIFCSSSPTDKPINILDDSFVPHVIETRDFAVGEYRLGPVTRKPVLGFGYPLVDENNQAQGVVIAAFYVTTLNELAAESLMPPGSTLTIRDRKGVVVARYPDPENWTGKSVPDAPALESIGAPAGESTVEAVGADGIQRLYAFTTVRGVPVNDLSVRVGIPTSVAYAEVNQGLTRNLFLLGLIGVLALAAAWIGGDLFLFRHVRALSAVTERLATGDLTARTGLTYGVGELSLLARAFDRMAEVIAQRETALTQAEERVRRWAAHLEGLINTVAEASSQPFEVNSIVDIALHRTLSAMDLDAGCVLLKNGEKLGLAAHHGLDPATAQEIRQLGSGESALCAIERWAHAGTVQEMNVETEPDAEPFPGGDSQDWTCVPIKSKGRVYGIMLLAGGGRQSPDAQEQRVLAAVGRQVGVAIENAELYGQVKSIAALKERERLGRELHDGLAQVLGYLGIKNKAAMDLIAAGQVARAEGELRQIQETMQAACQDIRESILGLRVTVSADGGLVSVLKEYVHKFSLQTGIRLTLITNGNEEMAYLPEAEVQLLRIIQEALSNVRKHSDAKQAWIKIDCQANRSLVTITDEGKGFDQSLVGRDSQPHYGLQTMRERAESVGGSLQVVSQPGHGTRVVVTLPLKGEA
jgi:nitrate/nitrite-specific signal transduction histidine kinase